MIFGTTTKDKKEAEQREIREMILGRLEFAWLPTQLHNGKWVWLEHFYAYYYGGRHEDGTSFLFTDNSRPYSRNSLERDDSLVSVSQEVTSKDDSMKTTVQRLTKAFSDAIPLGPHPNPYQEFISVRLNFVQEALGELHRLQLHEQANTMWIEKTDWVQDTSQPGELGWHRADCLKQRIERLQASNTELHEALKLAEGIAQRVIASTKFDERQISDWRPRVHAAIVNGGK